MGFLVCHPSDFGEYEIHNDGKTSGQILRI
jgi:hypothetical protein